MKSVGNTLVILGLLILIYSIIGRFFIGGPAIGLGFIKLKAISGVTTATFCVLLGIAVKLWDQ